MISYLQITLDAPQDPMIRAGSFDMIKQLPNKVTIVKFCGRSRGLQNPLLRPNNSIFIGIFKKNEVKLELSENLTIAQPQSFPCCILKGQVCIQSTSIKDHNSAANLRKMTGNNPNLLISMHIHIQNLVKENLTSIKGDNSDTNLQKITGNNPNVDQCIYKIWLNFLQKLNGNENLTLIKGHNSVINLRKSKPRSCQYQSTNMYKIWSNSIYLFLKY